MIFRPRRPAPDPQPAPSPVPAAPQPDPLVPPLSDPDPAAPDPPRRAGRLRTALILLACALAVALTATAPALMFALGDIARFAHPADIDNPYTSRTVDGDDLYLVRMLHERQEASVAASAGQQSSGQSLYLGASFSYDSMQNDVSLSVRCSEILRQLADGGVLPYNWVDETLAATSYDPYSFRGSSDSLGFTVIGYFPGWNGETQQMSMTLESRTGKLVSLQMIAPSDASAPDASTVLSAWIQLCDLDILGDWAAPAGTQWESTGLYSARGGLLATCVTVYNEDQGLWGISLDLVPCTQDELTAAAQAQDMTQAAQSTGTMVRMNTQSQQGYYFNSGSDLYFLELTDNGLYRMMDLDYESGTLCCVCQKSLCQHDSSDCPACFARDGAIYVDDSGQIYVFQAGESSDNVSHPAVLYAIDPGGKQTTVVATLYSASDLEPLAVCNGLLYIRQYGNAAGTNPLDDPTPDTVISVSLTTGQRSVTPTRMGSSEELLGVCDGFLVTVRQLDGRAFRNPLLTPSFLSTWTDQQICLEMDLLNPATGERYRITRLDGQYMGNGGGLYVSDTWLVPTWSSAPDAADMGTLTLWLVSLSSGSADEFVLPLPSLPTIPNVVPLASRMADGKSGSYSDLPWIYLSNLSDGNGTFYDAIYQMDFGSLLRIEPSLSPDSWQIIAVTDDLRLVLEQSDPSFSSRSMTMLLPWELTDSVVRSLLEENALTLEETLP